MSEQSSNDTVPMVQKHKLVEGKMWKTLKCLAETEGTIHLISSLKSRGLATNDVKNFVVKQTIHKRVLTYVDARVRNCAMQSKLKDALAHAKRLRQIKNTLRSKILKQYKTKAKGKRVVRSLVRKYRKLRNSEFCGFQQQTSGILSLLQEVS